MITSLQPHQVFVFGSNYAGRHGAGAAKQAMKWGAVYGVGGGRMGQTYGIPTKGYRLEILPLERIRLHVLKFIEHAAHHPRNEFLVTAIGTGLAGYKPEQIAPFFAISAFIPNIVLPEPFL